MKLQVCALAIVVVSAAACGDPETNDNRGYTKAPLEHPTVVIRGEEPSAMTQYGSPNRVVAEVIELAPPDTTAQQAGPDVANVQLPAGVTQEMVTAGQQVFSTTTCFTCHGTNGAGGQLAPALNDPDWLNIDGSFDALVQTVNDGVAKPKQFPVPMPPKGGAALTDDQVRQVAAYVFAISR